jgi:transposase
MVSLKCLGLEFGRIRAAPARNIICLVEMSAHVRSNALARRTQTRMGIGPITASAIVAPVDNGRDFQNGRQFAA